MSADANPAIDVTLARRLERAEGEANVAFVNARAIVEPSVGATWMDVAGVYAMFDGVGSPLTQTFGLGLFGPFAEHQFDAIEAFFAARGSSTFHEVSSFTPEATAGLLLRRGYVPVEESTVLIRATTLDAGAHSGEITVRGAGESEGEQWAHVSAQGWGGESADVAAFVEQLGRISARAHGVQCFLAEVDNVPIAAAALYMSGDVALLAGASTIPSARRRGAQNALLMTRLAFAASHGLALAMIVTQPASASQRNAERQGFRPVYSRTKWERRLDAP